MIKVLFFNYEYPPLGGGAGNATAYILREFSKNPELKLDLITSSINEKYHLEKIGDNINIHRLPIGKNKNNLHFQSQKELLVYTWRAYFFARKLSRKNNYDLTHSFFTVPCGPLSLLLWRRKKIPYIISLRGSDVPGYSERFSFIYKVLTPLIKYIWKKSRAVVANSLEFKKLAKKVSPQQEISVITNGIDGKEFSVKTFIEYENDDRRRQKFKVICGSRVTPRKGFRFIVGAINLLKKKGIKINLEIIGDGNEKNNLEKMVTDLNLQDQIKFLGIIKHTELPRYYQQANIYISASLNEGMSNTMLEALACGLPIVATKTGGTDEMVQKGKNGFIIEMNSAKDIAEKIESILNDFELEKKMSKNSRRLAESMYWENIAEEYWELYKAIKN